MHTIVLTGFKPFGPHAINDSEVCVQLIKDSDLAGDLNVDLVTEILDVAYESALETLKSLWKKHDPFLVIHCGVHNEDTVVLEKMARKRGYVRKDNAGTCPVGETCPIGEHEALTTKLDLSQICDCTPQNGFIHPSDDAGLYLCEYVYYISLSHDPAKTVFIHIPPNRSSVPCEKKVETIKRIIKELYNQRLSKTS